MCHLFCHQITYFQLDTEFYQQKDLMAMGSPLSSIITNIYMKHFEEMAITTAKRKRKLWVRYVDYTFVVWSRGENEVEDFRRHINSIYPSIKLTCEKESGGKFTFFNDTTVYRKARHTHHYLPFDLNHHNGIKKTEALSLFNRAKTICSNSKLYKKLKSNRYSNLMINQTRFHKKSVMNKEDKPYIQGISERVSKVLGKYNFKVAYKYKNTLRSFLTATKPDSSKRTKNC